jgi:hypothetical protein
MNNLINPKARDENLVVQELPEEVLVYDLKTDEAHCLNKTAAFVWKHCDGKTPVTDIAKLLESSFGNPVEDDFVRLAINLLDEKNLLNEKTSSRFNLPNRRELIKKIGLASVVALPIVASLTAPIGTLASVNCACVNPGDCAAQTGCNSLVNCNISGVCAP